MAPGLCGGRLSVGGAFPWGRLSAGAPAAPPRPVRSARRPRRLRGFPSAPPRPSFPLHREKAAARLLRRPPHPSARGAPGRDMEAGAAPGLSSRVSVAAPGREEPPERETKGPGCRRGGPARHAALGAAGLPLAGEQGGRGPTWGGEVRAGPRAACAPASGGSREPGPRDPAAMLPSRRAPVI